MKFEIYLGTQAGDDRPQYRWHLLSKTGRIVADSGEGYARMVDCQRAVLRVKDMCALAGKAEVTVAIFAAPGKKRRIRRLPMMAYTTGRSFTRAAQAAARR